MAITETVPTITAYAGTIPDKATQTPTAFANNVYPFHVFYNDGFITDTTAFSTSLNTWSTQANSLATTMNGYATAAADSATLSSEWAEKAEDSEVTTGKFSSLHWSAKSEGFSATSAASANNNGAWSALTGAFPTGESVNHNGFVWVSNVAIADVTASEPTDVNTDWTNVTGSSATTLSFDKGMFSGL